MSQDLTPSVDATSAVDPLVAIALETGQLSRLAPPSLVLNPAANPLEEMAKIGQQEAVAIQFSKSTDGRGYSLAARIREAGLRVQLHAVGALHPDLFYFLRRSGFDLAHLPDRQGILRDGLLPPVASQLLSPFGAHYQTSADGKSGLIGRAHVLREAA